jgi:hypothetical protein
MEGRGTQKPNIGSARVTAHSDNLGLVAVAARNRANHFRVRDH